ncbi:hypothetical protein BLA29_008999 [Euroglyphus maynei]|uniref:Uncharacterized protein n=1 Tax=Euroglyphus maynei TaxID=6958 RepID=A0A1Y3AY49_EURMA|nr:hypothetical protein BLA29_008999 [Euroglyphus maynei]
MITNLFAKLTNKFYLFYSQQPSSLSLSNLQRPQRTKRNDSLSSSSSMATMIMNGVAIPSMRRNGGPTAKFQIKPPINVKTALNSNHRNQKNVDEDDNQSKNIDDDHHFQLHIPGHNSSDLYFGYNVNVDDLVKMNPNSLENDQQQQPQTRIKKYSMQNNANNVIERNDNHCHPAPYR